MLQELNKHSKCMCNESGPAASLEHVVWQSVYLRQGKDTFCSNGPYKEIPATCSLFTRQGRVRMFGG